MALTAIALRRFVVEVDIANSYSQEDVLLFGE